MRRIFFGEKNFFKYNNSSIYYDFISTALQHATSGELPINTSSSTIESVAMTMSLSRTLRLVTLARMLCLVTLLSLSRGISPLRRSCIRSFFASLFYQFGSLAFLGITVKSWLSRFPRRLSAVSFQLLTFGRGANGQITFTESIKVTTEKCPPRALMTCQILLKKKSS